MGAAAAPRFVSKQKGNLKNMAPMRTLVEKGQRVKSKAPLRAARQVQYEWNGEDWDPVVEFNDTYYENGLLHVSVIKDLGEEEGLTQRDTYGYDTDGFQTSYLTEITPEEGGDFVNYRKRDREYDSIVKSLIVSNLEYIWGTFMGGSDEWMSWGNNYRRIVSRNDDGNVVSTVVETLYDGEFTPVEKLLVEYGDDKKASVITHEVLTYDDDFQLVWEADIEYRDIVWERTDGQIVNEDLTYDNNRIQSCTVIDEDGENHVEITYGENGSFKSVLTYDEGSLTASLDVLDEYGSSVYTVMETYVNPDCYCNILAKEVEREMFNLDGLQTEAYLAFGEIENMEDVPDNLMEVQEWMLADVGYDVDHGHTMVYTVHDYDIEEDEWVNMMRVEFSDYKEWTGIAAPAVEDAEAPVEYYNLQGIRIAEPQRGTVVIRRQGSDTRKVIY